MNQLNISQVLFEAYHHYPEKIAIRLLFSKHSEENISYKQLVQKSALFANALAKAGIQTDEVIIIVLEHSQELVFSFFGAILRGAIPSIMPFLTEKLSPDQYRSSLEALLEITKPAAVVTYKDFFPEIKKASAGTSVRAILVSEDICNFNSPQPHHQTTNLDKEFLCGLEQKPNDIALLQHSSGTTGLQKGVALSHQAIFNQLISYTDALGFSNRETVISWLPLYHDMGLIAGFIMPIMMGATLVLLSPFDWVRAPQRLFHAISKYRGTYCWLPNFAYNFCAQKIRPIDLNDIDLSSMKFFINCSEPVQWKSHKLFWERFSKFGLHPSALATSYAMAENVFAVTQGGVNEAVEIDCVEKKTFIESRIAKPAARLQDQSDLLSIDTHEENPETLLMVSAGKAIEGTKILILDQDGNSVPDRVVGELAIKSNCMLTGYYHRPDLTEKAFFDGWYLTGDLGYQVNGQIFITGRKKDLIIVGGKNIYPQDIERLASEVEGVYPGRAVAFGVYNEKGGTEDVVVIAETYLDEQQFLNDPEIEKKLEKISTEIRQRVNTGSDISLRYVHMVYRNWLIKTSSGKIARSANRDKYLSRTS